MKTVDLSKIRNNAIEASQEEGANLQHTQILMNVGHKDMLKIIDYIFSLETTIKRLCYELGMESNKSIDLIEDLE